MEYLKEKILEFFIAGKNVKMKPKNLKVHNLNLLIQKNNVNNGCNIKKKKMKIKILKKFLRIIMTWMNLNHGKKLR